MLAMQQHDFCFGSYLGFARTLFILLVATGCTLTHATASEIEVTSPDQSNLITLKVAGGAVSYRVSRNGHSVLNDSAIQPLLVTGQLETGQLIDQGLHVDDVERSEIDESFEPLWGKSNLVENRYTQAVVTLASGAGLQWQIELRAFNDGVAFRYRLVHQPQLAKFALQDEVTEFKIAGTPTVMFNTLDSFTTSHESLYDRKQLAEIPVQTLMDCPALFDWPDGPAAAITEARVLNFAGMYLERPSSDSTSLRTRLSPLPSQPEVAVTGQTPHVSPWRVVLLADTAGKLIESNLLLCLNDPPSGDFTWAKPGKSTFHWWYGAFEDDYKSPTGRQAYVARHKQYIDFCAENNIAYHALSGDGLSWYKQASDDYAVASDDADVTTPRPEIGLFEILEYARERNVGIRLWVHWQALDKQIDKAMATYESWGVKGLMVDFLDRDDQQMLDYSQRMLESAAEHKIHIQIHGSSKYSGEHRTFPHLFNREGVLNLEYVKWSNFCTPQHSVNVAYTRALAGPVDFHLGGFRSVPRAEFKFRDRQPVVMGTRCHNLALYVAYINPMPMVADDPSSYEGQTGFEFIRQVPTTWDESRFLAGEPGEYFIIARRSGNTWYLAGITNWTARNIELKTDFLASRQYAATTWFDGSLEEDRPNEIDKATMHVNAKSKLSIDMASGGGFVAVLKPK